MRLIVVGAGWLLGLYVGSRLGLPLVALALALPAAIALAFLFRRRWRWLLASLLVVAVLAGLLRFHYHDDAAGRETLALHNDSGVVEIRGIVASSPELPGSVTRFRLSAREILLNGEWQPVSGQVRVSARESRELVAARDPPYFRPGDLLQVKGKLESPQPFGDFDFPAYLAQQGVRSVMAFPQLSLLDTRQGPALERALFSLRNRLSDSLSEAIPGPQNAVAQAVTLGIRHGLPSDLSEEFNESGTTHLLAISGLHVAIVMGMALALSRRLFWRPRLLVYLLPLIAIWLYAMLAGLAPSAERAAIMGSFYLAALYFGRQRHGLEALLLAAFFITAFNPTALWQVSFHLSFLAMAGIVLVAPTLLDYAGGQGFADRGVIGALGRGAVVIMAMGLAATLFTWPAIAFYFHRVSLVGIPATVLALPALPLVLIASLITGVVGLVSTDAALAFGWVAWLGLSYVLGVVNLFASVPLAAVQLDEVGRALALAYYSVIAAMLWALRSVRRLRAVLSSWVPRPGLALPRGPTVTRFQVLALSLTALAALVWWAALPQPRDRLDLTVLDIGRGDAILLRTPSRQTILVDGGSAPQVLSQAVGRRLPFWSRHIDLVIATHPDEDHVGGLAQGLDGYSIGAVLETGVESASAAHAAWREAVRQRGIPWVDARAGQQVHLGEDLRLEVLHPPERLFTGTDSDANNNSIVVRVSYGAVSFLLTGDIVALAEAYLLDQDLRLASTVLKVAHHGSDTSSTAEFLEAVRPSVAVISVDADNRFGHPHQSTLERIRSHVPEEGLFVTGLHGSVRFSTDGERLWVTTER